MVICCFWFPDVGNPFHAVQLTALTPQEWAGLAKWAVPRHRELPALAELLSGSLPTEVAPADVLGLSAECGRVDWDSLPGPALGGFASLSMVVSQAVAQARAGLRFVPDAE
jgi:hypothetical protein